jgi:transcriptional regulator with XRE-family HTH domain
MAEKGDPRVTRHLVIYLRTEAGMTQAAFGKAARVDQGDVSRYELGKDAPPEKALRRMAEVPDVPWEVVVHLRRFLTAIVAASDRRRAEADEVGAESWEPEILETELLAAAPYLLADAAEETGRKTPEEEEREAEAIWTALERFPIPRRRRLLELAPLEHRTPALVERVRRASLDAAARKADEAGDLVELARFTAEQVRLAAS